MLGWPILHANAEAATPAKRICVAALDQRNSVLVRYRLQLVRCAVA